MPWPLITLRERRRQVRDSVASHLPGADATIPNSVLRELGESQANLTHDNDAHLDWVARMMMPDTAEGEFVDRWANIWLRQGRKSASHAFGQATISGVSGSSVEAGTELTARVIDSAGETQVLLFEISTGITLSGPSGVASIEALTPGALGNLDEGAQLSFVELPAGIDGQAIVAAPGLAGGADVEPDTEVIDRYIDVIQDPPHGGKRNDYVQWAKEVPGVTRAWAVQDQGVGTMTVRVLMDAIFAGAQGVPDGAALTVIKAHIDTVRPVTVYQLFVVAPTVQAMNITITDLANDTPEVRTNIATELREMLKARAAPGQTIYASWIREAISAAVGEDWHDTAIANQVPSSGGHMIFLGNITYS